MGAVAGDLYLFSPGVFATLAAVLLLNWHDAPACRMRTFVLLNSSHDYLPFPINREGGLLLIAAALLVASLVGFLVYVLFEVPILAVVPVMRTVILAFAHPLLVCLVFRIILFVVLEEWSRHSLYHASGDTQTHHYRQNPNATF
jgi:hypothetical protein